MDDGIVVGDDLGPKMSRLDERERAFVRAMLDYPTAHQGKWAKLAGYGGPKVSWGSLRVAGHHVAHRQRVLDAVEEETRKRIRLGGAIGIMGLMKIAVDPKHRGHQKACEALADRAGFAPQQNIAVAHTHVDLTGKAMEDEIRRLAAKHGLDPVKLLGSNVHPSPATGEGQVLEGEFEEVKADARS